MAVEYAKVREQFGRTIGSFQAVKHRLVDLLALVELARDEKDYATDNFLQWFVAEQVEEEATADGILQKLKMIGEHPHGIFMMNAKLGERKES